MAKASTISVQRDINVSCPACTQPLSGRVTVEVTPGELVGNELIMRGKLVGFQIDHDCTPRVTRTPNRIGDGSGFPSVRD